MKKFTALALVSVSLFLSTASAAHSAASGKAQLDAGDVSVTVLAARAKGPVTGDAELEYRAKDIDPVIALRAKGPATIDSELDLRAKGPVQA